MVGKFSLISSCAIEDVDGEGVIPGDGKLLGAPDNMKNENRLGSDPSAIETLGSVVNPSGD